MDGLNTVGYMYAIGYCFTHAVSDHQRSEFDTKKQQKTEEDADFNERERERKRERERERERERLTYNFNIRT